VQEGLSWLEKAIPTATAEAPASGFEPPERDLVRALFWAGVLLDDAGRPDESAARLEACLAIQQEIGDDVGAARTLNSLGVVARSVGDLDRARSLIEESIERKRALGDRAGISGSLDNLGIVASDLGQFDEAIRLMSEALELDLEAGGSVVFLSRVNLGSVFIRAGRLHEGARELSLALPGVEKLGDPELVVEVMLSLARVALASPGDAAAHRAGRLIVAADVLRQEAGLPIRPNERAELDELLARVSVRMPASGLDSLRAEAEATDFDAAISLARDALEAIGEGAPSPPSA
jgi:tetratricopeptide (TPR) repeat protein